MNLAEFERERVRLRKLQSLASDLGFWDDVAYWEHKIRELKQRWEAEKDT
jgi:hypothetical protein